MPNTPNQTPSTPNKKHARKAKHQIRQKKHQIRKKNTKYAKKYTKYAKKNTNYAKKNTNYAKKTPNTQKTPNMQKTPNTPKIFIYAVLSRKKFCSKFTHFVGVLFTDLKSMVVYQNGQISGIDMVYFDKDNGQTLFLDAYLIFVLFGTPPYFLGL